MIYPEENKTTYPKINFKTSYPKINSRYIKDLTNKKKITENMERKLKEGNFPPPQARKKQMLNRKIKISDKLGERITTHLRDKRLISVK